VPNNPLQQTGHANEVSFKHRCRAPCELDAELGRSATISDSSGRAFVWRVRRDTIRGKEVFP
jgi:hypothetical protein